MEKTTARSISWLPVLCLLAGGGWLLTGCGQGQEAPPVAPKPNIIYILADDLGYGDLGAYGQQRIETPNLDRLAASGIRFTRHYAGAPVCAPSRYMLLTGKHSGHSYIRGNDEWADRGPVWDYRAMARDSTLEGQRPLPESEVLLPEKLQEAGYRTGMFGKWGLGAPHTNSIPTERGFDYFYGYNCQRQAHTYYPLHLYENNRRVHLENDTIAPHSGFEPGVALRDYGRFDQQDYAPDLIFDAMDRFIREGDGSPIFVYWATPIPHVPLQAPERWISYYRDKFGPEPPYESGPDSGYFPQEFPRAAYAAMISYLDEQVGRLLDRLAASGLLENTLILFSSDNGPSYAGGADPDWFDSGGPFRETYGRGKGFVYEGGIRVPLIASWPGAIAAGQVTDHLSAQYDLMATLAGLAGFEVPSEGDGISFLPTLTGRGTQQKHDQLVWAFPEYGGQLALRSGPWKVVLRELNNPAENPAPELYNLDEDPGEGTDLSERFPEMLDSLLGVLAQEYEVPEIAKFRLTEWESRLEQANSRN
ncbi:arylsulfatase [Robiginitalea sp. SC105]|uniref:arylsulfatase n=1 Tax=Robiginitalea sp. SC105 TaxID=2762332 RepID=UPI00163AF6AF|nr:arylsulfatase [Robiginitalea sp. SC105]MBC2839344.1 arylsulfatase [Robiginitalea sp. SC105]